MASATNCQALTCFVLVRHQPRCLSPGPWAVCPYTSHSLHFPEVPVSTSAPQTICSRAEGGSFNCPGGMQHPRRCNGEGVLANKPHSMSPPHTGDIAVVNPAWQGRS
ncbi:hypothetical protein GDO81_029543 [Engystomops pustulosus]|uniref:Uncharacterized protein n=1 Tax=Engystomops pustulosus TaxID=76066 RepID=A0AAV6YE71_ENGPU|nr:hypothetical protein GDO81_029543 [Engystomops pustulosus]